MRQTEILIIGQGIAGSLTAFMLHQQEIPFLVMDPGYSNTASRVAAGMFTPISGKRKTINKELLEQIPFAITVYRQIEKLLNKNFLHVQDVYYVPNSAEEQDEFIKKQNTVDYTGYVHPATTVLPNIKQTHGAFEITNSGWVDCALFTNSFKNWLKQKNALIEEAFDYDEIKITNDKIQYKDIECKKVIFCEGYRAINNPFFKEETIIPCKGDMLTIENKECETAFIIKKDSAYLIPFGDHTFKAGSTYIWGNSNETPDESGKKEIADKLNAMLENDYTIVQHQSAIRPTTKNREVIMKQHSVHSNMFMLNGFGTKGIIQGPYWAKQIVSIAIKQL